MTKFLYMCSKLKEANCFNYELVDKYISILPNIIMIEAIVFGDHKAKIISDDELPY